MKITRWQLGRIIREQLEEEEPPAGISSLIRFQSAAPGEMLDDRSFYAKWKNDLPRKTAERYLAVFGPPDEVGRDFAKWDDIANFGGPTVIKDEEISHTEPVKHIDFVYSTRPIRVPARKVGVLAETSGSIIVDQLKEEVTARCHYLIKNAVTLGFVEDVVAGKIPDEEAQAEYARRITNNIYPDWFADPLGEYEETLAVDVAHHLEINK